MRILQVMASGVLGGGAVHVRGLARALAALGHAVTCVVGDDGPLATQLRADGFIVFVLARGAPLSDVRALVKLGDILRAQSYDVMHVHGTRAALWAAAGRRLISNISCPVVYTVHGLSFRPEGLGARHQLRRGLERFAAMSADGVISVSCRDLKILTRVASLEPHRSCHLPNAVRVGAFDRTSQTEARRKLGLPTGAFVVGTISRLVPQKNVALFLDALSRVPGAYALIVGAGPEEALLRRRAAALGDRIRFLGARDDAPLLLAALDTVVLSSRWEGEPIVLLEAMAARRPWIATRTPGSEEVWSAAPNAGLLVAQGDADALARAIVSLKENPAQRDAMGHAGAAHVRRRTFRKLADRTFAFYTQVLV